MEFDNVETRQKSIRIPVDLYDKIIEDAIKENRDFTKQLNYIVRQYYEIKKTLK